MITNIFSGQAKTKLVHNPQSHLHVRVIVKAHWGSSITKREQQWRSSSASKDWKALQQWNLHDHGRALHWVPAALSYQKIPLSTSIFTFELFTSVKQKESHLFVVVLWIAQVWHIHRIQQLPTVRKERTWGCTTKVLPYIQSWFLFSG